MVISVCKHWYLYHKQTAYLSNDTSWKSHDVVNADFIIYLFTKSRNVLGKDKFLVYGDPKEFNEVSI